MQAFERLETEFAEFIGFRPEQVVAVSSGTAALHVAIEALRLPPGSEVITGDFNMVAVPRAITMAGLTPVFVDCGDNLLMSLGMVPMGQYPETCIAVHIYGRGGLSYMDSLMTLYSNRGIAIIEDLAEAHGIRPHPLTDAAAFSFYSNKIIAGSEGGAVAFRDPEHAALARQLRCLGFTAKHDFMHVPRGHNYRMSNVHAELILDSLRKYPENLKARREIEAWYEAECPPELRMPPRDAPWVYDLKLPEGTQDECIGRLHAAGVMARYWFRPMSTQEEFCRCRVVGNGNAARLSRQGIYLPLTPGITREQVRKSFEIIREVAGG